MEHLKKITLVFTLIFSTTSYGSEFSVEVDPATYVFSGYALHARYHFANHWALSLGTYAMTFPKLLNREAISPGSSSATLKIKSAYGLFLDRYLLNKNSGLFLGLQIARQNYQLSDSDYPGMRANYSATLIMPRLGYKYQLPHSRFYLLPWVGVGYVSPSVSHPSVGVQDYTIKSTLAFATLHIGYTF